MTNPVTDAFFFGKALAEVLNEKLGETLTNLASELGKFDAEQREKLRQFTEEVTLRANLEQQNSSSSSSSASVGLDSPEELQKMIDDLRAEIAGVRAELNKYRSQ